MKVNIDPNNITTPRQADCYKKAQKMIDTVETAMSAMKEVDDVSGVDFSQGKGEVRVASLDSQTTGVSTDMGGKTVQSALMSYDPETGEAQSFQGSVKSGESKSTIDANTYTYKDMPARKGFMGIGEKPDRKVYTAMKTNGGAVDVKTVVVNKDTGTLTYTDRPYGVMV
jgi:hypothetical protein